MMYQWLVYTFVCLACLTVGAIVGIITDRWLREGEQLTERSERMERGRHARTQPRTSLVKPAAPRAVLPIPGPSKPQPGRDSGPGTVTFGKVPDSATGPIAKLIADNETWMAEQAVEDEIFRLGLALD